MSVVIKKKSGITFKYNRLEGMTTIIATANNYDLQTIFANVKLVKFGLCIIEVLLTTSKNYGYLFNGCCYRSRSFAEKLACEIIQECFSHLGKRRRMKDNKAKKAEVE